MSARESRQRGWWLALVVLFLAGFSGLVYEVVWTRALTLTFGGTVVAAAAVLCAFMGGLALGSWVSGKWADRHRSLGLLAAGLQLALGVAALGLLPVLSWLTGLYVLAYRTLDASFYMLTGIRFVLSVLVLLVPAALIASVFPVVTKWAASARGRMGQSVALAYGIDTLGGVAGAAVGGFVLLPTFGMTRSIEIAAGLNLAASLLAFLVHRWSGGVGAAERTQESGAASSGSSGWALPPRTAQVLLWGFAASGAAALAYEVMVTKALVNIIGMHAHAFSTMLSCFLFGIGAGSLLSMGLLRRRRTPLHWFAFAEAGIGLIGLSLPLQFTWIPDLIALVQSHGWPFWLARVVVTLAVLLAPTLLMGATLPLLVPVLTPGLRKLGRSTGVLYSVNTVGGAVGASAATFVLLPFVGFKGGMLAAGCLNLLVAFAALYYSRDLSGRLRGLAAALIVTAAACVAATSAGTSLDRALLLRQLRPKSMLYPLVRFYREGANGTVAVVRLYDPRVGFEHEMWLNAGNEGGSSIDCLRTFQLLGHLPFFLHRDQARQKSALVCAFGMGIALGAVTQDDSESVVCVELVPEVLEASRFFSNYNHDPLDNPKVRVKVEDARNFLLATEEKFDIVVADATHPKSGDSWMLYTQEWYREIRRVLEPDGVCAQWVPIHSLSRADFWSIVKTFQSVFPHASLWSPPGCTHTVLVGTSEPTRIDFTYLAHRLEEPALRRDFEAAEFTDIYSVLSCFAAGEETLTRRAAQFPLNTDDLCPVEFSGGVARRKGFPAAYYEISSVKENPLALMVNLGSTAEERALRAERIAKVHEAAKLLREALALRKRGGEEAARATTLVREAYELNPEDRDLRLLLKFEGYRLRTRQDLPEIEREEISRPVAALQ